MNLTPMLEQLLDRALVSHYAVGHSERLPFAWSARRAHVREIVLRPGSCEHFRRYRGCASIAEPSRARRSQA